MQVQAPRQSRRSVPVGCWSRVRPRGTRLRPNAGRAQRPHRGKDLAGRVKSTQSRVLRGGGEHRGQRGVPPTVA